VRSGYLIKVKRFFNLSFIFLTALVMVVMGCLVSRSIRRPLKRLREGAEAIAAGDLEFRTGIRKNNEMGDLSKAFDLMAGNLSESYRELEYQIEQCEKTQESLRTSEEKFRGLFSQIPDPIIVTDIELNRVEDANPAALDEFGYSRGQLIGMDISDLTTEDEREKMIAGIAPMGGEQTLSKWSGRYSREDGTDFTAEVTARLLDIEGKRKCVRVIRDVTERQTLEAKVQNVKRVESLGLLAGGIAHKFNNILTGIVGDISLSKNFADLESPIYQRLEKSEKACRSAEIFVSRLLPFSRGGAPVKIQESVKEFLETAVISQPNDLFGKVQLDIEKGLWKADIDRNQVSGAIGEIVQNAADAMEKKGLLTVKAGI